MLSQICRFIVGVLEPIYNAGILPDADIKEENRLHTMNAFYAICCVLSLCYCTYYIFVTKNIIAFSIIFLGGILCRIVIVLNTKHLYDIANTLGIIATGGIVFAISVNEGLSQGFWLYYSLTPLMTLSFFANYDKKIPIISFAFYAIVFIILVYSYFHGYTHEATTKGFNVLLFANFLVVFIFGLFFTYNFQHISNQSYANIAAQNAVLILKNDRIDVLVKVLNDRVKNNIQVMSILGEMDLLTNLAISSQNYTKRYAIRLKILDLNYKMIHELKTESAQYYQFFLEGYAKILKRILPTYLETTTVTAELCPKIAANPKDFDAMMILYNEVLVHFLFSIAPSTPLCVELCYKIDENQQNTIEFILTNKGKERTTNVTISSVLLNFAKLQKIEIETIATPQAYRVLFTPRSLCYQ